MNRPRFLVQGLLALMMFSYSMKGYSDVIFPKLDIGDISRVLSSHSYYKKRLSKDAWVITIYAFTLPYPIEDVKSAILNPNNHTAFYRVNKNYWINALQAHTTGATLVIDNIFLTGDAQKKIQSCSHNTCDIKLNEQEINTLINSSEKTKTYAQLVKDRINAFTSHKKFVGYDRPDNTPIYQAMLNALPLSKENVTLSSLISTGSLYCENVDLLSSSIGHVLLKIYWQSLYVQDDVHFIFNFDIYTNHFFDSGMKAHILMPAGKNKTYVITYYNYEVDELKKGFFFHILFKERFYDYQLLVQEHFAQSLEKWLANSVKNSEN